MKPTSQKGSILIASLILAIVIAIGAGSFISLCLSNVTRSTQSFYFNSAMNLAEAGAEEAMWAMNNGDWSKRGWSTGPDRTLLGSINSPDMTDANGAKGFFNVHVRNAGGNSPVITAEANVQGVKGTYVRKQIRLYAQTSNVFMPPFTAITEMKLNGGEIDSYDQTQGDYTTAPRKYNTTVASPTISIGDMAIGSPADIYGNVSIGVSSDQATNFINSIKGSLVGPTTAVNDPGVVKSGSNLIDTNRVSYDFTQDFPPPADPGGMPYATTLPAADAHGYIIIGDSSPSATTRRYELASITIGSGKTLLIVGPVQLSVVGNVTVSGQGAISILQNNFALKNNQNAVIANYTGSTLAKAEIYAKENVSISGNGTVIPVSSMGRDPTLLQIYGLGGTSQQITIGGNGNLAASIYAPNASVTFNGGGSSGFFAGAVVSNEITVNGNGYRVRFPEQMANMSTGTTYKISKWLELTNASDFHTF